MKYNQEQTADKKRLLKKLQKEAIRVRYLFKSSFNREHLRLECFNCFVTDLRHYIEQMDNKYDEDKVRMEKILQAELEDKEKLNLEFKCSEDEKKRVEVCGAFLGVFFFFFRKILFVELFCVLLCGSHLFALG